MAEVLEYKCVNCGGILEFNSDKQKLVCPYCDSEFAPDTVQQGKVDEYDEPVFQREDDYIETMKHYICESCGGEIDVNEDSVADFCPFCSRPVIMSDRVSKFLKPDYVIPFKVNKDKAKEGYIQFAKKYKRLVPRDFMERVAPDNIKGMYIPYWLYDADTETHTQFEGIIETTWTVGNTEYTKKDYYNVYRTCDNSYSMVPVDGSSKIDNKVTESIEPFNYDEKLDFQSAYLSGYFAEKYDLDDKACYTIAYDRMKETDIDMTRRTISGYDSLTIQKSTMKTENNEKKYALMPVWLMSSDYKGKNYQYASNGQTGKFVGKLPVSKGRCVGLWFQVFAIAGVISGLVSFLISLLNK